MLLHLQVGWDDVGGLEGIKQQLKEAVLWPQHHAEALQRLGATAPKGKQCCSLGCL
jgi:transitional endoplasmic reticulum ATPase